MNSALTVRSATRFSSTLGILPLGLSMLLASLGTSSANAGLVAIGKAMEAPMQDVQWVVLAYLLSITTLSITAGRLGDVFGRKPFLLAGIALFGTASLACAVSPALGWLIASRALQGVGAAIMMALSLAMVGDTVPRERVGAALGVLGSMSAVGTALGPSLGGLVTASHGWSAIFLLNLPIAAVVLVLASKQLSVHGAEKPSGKIDLWGIVLLAIALGAYSLSMTIGKGAFGALNSALLAIAAIFTTAFAVWQKRVESPVFHTSLLRSATVRSGLVSSLVVSSVMMSTLVVGPFYLSYALQLDPFSLGIVLSVGPAVVVLLSVPVGKLADRVGAARLATYGMIAIGAGCAVLSLVPIASGVLGYLMPVVLATAGYAAFQTSNNTVVMTSGASADRGVVSGMLNLSRNLGLITGASVLTAVFRIAGSNNPSAASPEVIARGFHATFLVAAVLIGVALATSKAYKA